jgi:endonuclease/exonuclease/phosphatase family metal-dependent hydrolase
LARRGLSVALALIAGAAAAQEPPAEGAIRLATFNASLTRSAPGGLVQALRLGDDRQIAAVVAIIRLVRPDVLLINELDHDDGGVALGLFAAALADGADGIDYPHRFAAPSNTGEPSGLDLTGDGRTDGPGDAFGFGRFRGQYGMALLSRLPLGLTRTFRLARWADMPGALLPATPPDAAAMRLSSKSHWDVAVETPAGALRVLASHPTPPIVSDLNIRRNADEIRFWIDYLDGADWMTDDAGRRGGFDGGPFAVMGDLNADPADGDGRRAAIRALLAHPALRDPAPRSEGGRAAADPGHAGDPALDTAAFRGPGALRVDYVLPSRDLAVTGAGVFWPPPGDPLRRLVGEGDPVVSSDHRLVWLDVRLP